MGTPTISPSYITSKNVRSLRQPGNRLTHTALVACPATQRPIRCGLPLARGFARRAEDLTLLAPDGRAVPVQLLTTGTYHDGTPRWVLLDFQTSLPAGGKAVYRLARGPRAPVHEKLVYRLKQGVAKIDTGAGKFRIDTNRFRLFDSVTVGGKELLTGEIDAGGKDTGAVPEQEDGFPHMGDRKTTQVEFEDVGPMSVVLCVRGQIRPGEKLPLVKTVCRTHFYAGRSEVRVFYTLHNPAAHRHPGNAWDLGSGGSVFMEDFSGSSQICVPQGRHQGEYRCLFSVAGPP